MRKWSVPTWVFVAFGLLLNIISALMTNFSIDHAMREANGMIQQQESNEKLIGLTWQQIETIERKRELVLILTSIEDVNHQPLAASVKEQVIAEVDDWLNISLSDLSIVEIPALMQRMNDVQAEYRHKIDRLYIQNLALAQSYQRVMESISRQRNLALFLQVLGLALMLARDLRWRELK
ncbi:hypothetical protein [Photobacterium sp. TY1-4]|uniref:hypothetical protein n=1 Tax=Photobacterium sp. TY1-4 TaxID=2899122 RepID=UPI0021C097A2|nr:hypothetical protein [Photobacterium sp. TY1-4]UXI04436.1 hypothetical protein NH461_20330 [Photobacterium sp. TY1-4]